MCKMLLSHQQLRDRSHSRVVKGHATTTVDEYHSYARDCLRWAAKARTEEQREQLLSLAKDWTQAAEALDGYLSQGISTARIGTVRAVYGLGWLGLSRRRGVAIHRARRR